MYLHGHSNRSTNPWLRKPPLPPPFKKKQKTRTAKAQAEKPSYESSSWIRKLGLQKPKQKNRATKSSSRVRRSGLPKPKKKNRATKAQEESEKPDCKSPSRNPELRKLKPNQKTRTSYKNSLASPIWIRKARWTNRDTADALEWQWSHLYLLGMLTERRYCERLRQGYCFGGSRAKFTKFSHKNCAKIVLIQVSWHAKSWANFPSRMWVRSLKSMDSWGTMRLEC